MERSTRANYSPLEAMRMARLELGQRLNSVVFNCLYEKAPNLSATIESIVSLSNVRRIICSNYDDVLEDGYAKRGINFRPLAQGDYLPLDDDQILIFHPHGFLPRTKYSRDYRNDPIVLSEDDYHDLYATPYSWANTIQLNLLISFSVLFIGSSLKDPNLRRLLDLSRKVRATDHFALLPNPDSQLVLGDQRRRKRWWAEFISFQKHVETENLLGRGVTPIWYEEHAEVSSILGQIA